MRPATRDRIFRLLLRVSGTAELFALIFIVAPESWMVSIHDWLGLGELPGQPIVGYLARSTSAFYAMMGGLMWVVSFDLVRHRQVLLYLGVAQALFGVALLGIDTYEGLPLSWTLFEGPVVIPLGLATLWLARQLPNR
tara:strand:+ start:130 stop:543 length:414 start_codon:yes stop_codon:yes gene_type:complete